MSEGPSGPAPPPSGAGDPTSTPGATAGPSRAGSHRAQRSAASTVLPVLVVAVAVVAVGVGVYGWVTAASSPDALADTNVNVPVQTVPPAVTPTTSPTGSASPSTSPSKSAKPTKSSKPTKSAKPTSTPKPTKTKTPPVARETPVVVLNQTSITGLAARTGASLKAKGWTIAGVGNWRGNVVATTVYYGPGHADEAKLLARDLGANRVLPRVTGMRVDRLTIILTSG